MVLDDELGKCIRLSTDGAFEGANCNEKGMAICEDIMVSYAFTTKPVSFQ